MKDIYLENKARKRRREIQNMFRSGSAKERFQKAYSYSASVFRESYNQSIKAKAKSDMNFFRRRINRYPN